MRPYISFAHIDDAEGKKGFQIIYSLLNKESQSSFGFYDKNNAYKA